MHSKFLCILLSLSIVALFRVFDVHSKWLVCIRVFYRINTSDFLCNVHL